MGDNMQSKNRCEEGLKTLLTQWFAMDFFHIARTHVDPKKDMWTWDWRLLFSSFFSIVLLLYINIRFLLAGMYKNHMTIGSIGLLIFPLIVFIFKVKKLKNLWNEDNKNTLIRYSLIFLFFIFIFFFLDYVGIY